MVTRNKSFQSVGIKAILRSRNNRLPSNTVLNQHDKNTQARLPKLRQVRRTFARRLSCYEEPVLSQCH